MIVSTASSSAVPVSLSSAALPAKSGGKASQPCAKHQRISMRGGGPSTCSTSTMPRGTSIERNINSASRTFWEDETLFLDVTEGKPEVILPPAPSPMRGTSDASNIASAPDRLSLIRQAFRLEHLTLAWMTIESTVSIGSGIAANSLVLIAFGLDSLIELASAAVLLWRLTVELRQSQ